MNDQINLFWDSTRQFLNKLATSLPQVLGAILFLIIGWLIAKLIKKLVTKGLVLARFPKLTEKTGIDKFFRDGGLKVSATDVIGTLVYWTIMLIVIFGALNSLNLTAASELFNQIILFIPNVIISIIILLFGIYIARMVSQMLLASLKNMKESTAHSISNIAYYAIITLTIFITLSQLNIAPEIINSAFQLLFGGLCLALGLAFGLGGKDKAAKIINDISNKDL